jgi:hypothetical protein
MQTNLLAKLSKEPLEMTASPSIVQRPSHHLTLYETIALIHQLLQFQDADEILRKLSRELQHDPDSSDVQRYDVALERAMSCLLLGRVDQAKAHLGLDTSPPTGGIC